MTQIHTLYISTLFEYADDAGLVNFDAENASPIFSKSKYLKRMRQRLSMSQNKGSAYSPNEQKVSNKTNVEIDELKLKHECPCCGCVLVVNRHGMLVHQGRSCKRDLNCHSHKGLWLKINPACQTESYRRPAPQCVYQGRKIDNVHFSGLPEATPIITC